MRLYGQIPSLRFAYKSLMGLVAMMKLLRFADLPPSIHRFCISEFRGGKLRRALTIFLEALNQ